MKKERKFLEIDNLSLQKDKTYLLKNISLSFDQGKVYSIVGPNGAGKSTLGYVLMGLEKYKKIQGNVYYENHKINSWDVVKRSKKGITLSWQEPVRFQGLSVKKYLEVSKTKDEVHELEIHDSLEKVGLSPEKYLGRAVDDHLSGGERKRIELASIMLMKPKIVILDEPDSGIDIEAQEMILESIEYLKSKGTTVIIITHNIKYLNNSDYAYLLCSGIIKDQGKPEEIRKYFENKCLKCKSKPFLYLKGGVERVS